MRHIFFGAVFATVMALAAISPRADAQQSTPQSFTREQIEQIIREYLLANPEVIIEAVEGLEAKRRGEAAASRRNALAAKQDELLKDPTAPIAGNPNGDVTIVEFFDYRCPYCKQVVGALTQLLNDDRKLRLVFKEFPILGPDSVVAARAALAAHVQGKYHAMHEALMRARGTLDETTVLKIATSVGLDATRLQSDMNKPEIAASLDRNHRLARDLAINGTPAFVIGNHVVPGAVDLETLKKLVAEARQR